MSTAFGHLPLIFKLFYAVILWEYHRVTGIFEIRKKKNWESCRTKSIGSTKADGVYRNQKIPGFHDQPPVTDQIPLRRYFSWSRDSMLHA